MDYYQGVVFDYLQTNRSVFLNVECCIQLAKGPHKKIGPHWICDAVAVNLRSEQARLCEVTYAKSPSALIKRLTAWAENWPGVRAALERDCGVPSSWFVQPWAFVPEARVPLVERRLEKVPYGRDPGQMPKPLIKILESVVPWKNSHWDEHENSWVEGCDQPK